VISKELIMNEKGFTLIELMIVVMIFGIIAAIVIGAVVKTNRTEYKEDVIEIPNESLVITTPLKMTGSIKCLGGHKVIELNGKTYWIGEEPDSWGDLKALPCE